MSFASAVVRFILKKTSLLLSVTLIFKCSDAFGGSSGSRAAAPADFSRSDILLSMELTVSEAEDEGLKVCWGQERESLLKYNRS